MESSRGPVVDRHVVGRRLGDLDVVVGGRMGVSSCVFHTTDTKRSGNYAPSGQSGPFLGNASVHFLLPWGKRRVLRFAPLQGQSAEHLLSEPQRTDLNTLYLVHGGSVYSKSDAWIVALVMLVRAFSLAREFKLVPRMIRDTVYDWVAKHRCRFFGKRETCRVPSTEERAAILD